MNNHDSTTHLLTDPLTARVRAVTASRIRALRRQAEGLANAAADYAADIACMEDGDIVKIVSSRGLHHALVRVQQHLQSVTQLEAALATIHSLGLAEVDADDEPR